MPESADISPVPSASNLEKAARLRMLDAFRSAPIPEHELLDNLALFTRRQHVASTLALAELYGLILDVHGIICEFGVRWGRNLATFSALRGIYEPSNFYRKIVGFDTFAGFPSVSEQDGHAKHIFPGAFNVTPGYEEYLDQLLACHEIESPLSHIRKFEVRKGDAAVELKGYLGEHPETIIALAYFDLDLYAPTRDCLEAIQPYLAKGSVVAFDELGHPEFPGETIALREVLGTRGFHLHRTQLNPSPSFLIID